MSKENPQLAIPQTPQDYPYELWEKQQFQVFESNDKIALLSRIANFSTVPQVGMQMVTFASKIGVNGKARPQCVEYTMPSCGQRLATLGQDYAFPILQIAATQFGPQQKWGLTVQTYSSLDFRKKAWVNITQLGTRFAKLETTRSSEVPTATGDREPTDLQGISNTEENFPALAPVAKKAPPVRAKTPPQQKACPAPPRAKEGARATRDPSPPEKAPPQPKGNVDQDFADQRGPNKIAKTTAQVPPKAIAKAEFGRAGTSSDATAKPIAKATSTATGDREPLRSVNLVPAKPSMQNRLHREMPVQDLSLIHI